MIVSALPSAASEKRTGTNRMSAVAASVTDGDTVQMDGTVATDADGNPIAFVNAPGTTGAVSVQIDGDEAGDDEVTVNHGEGAETDVTVFAVVE